jgi:hypothetical protein
MMSMSMNNDATACARTLSTARRQAPHLTYSTVLYRMPVYILRSVAVPVATTVTCVCDAHM